MVCGVVVMLSKQYTKWIVLGNVIAWPIVYFTMDRWMRNFAYKSGISVWPFLAAAVLVVVLLTVSNQTLKAALTNPPIRLSMNKKSGSGLKIPIGKMGSGLKIGNETGNGKRKPGVGPGNPDRKNGVGPKNRERDRQWKEKTRGRAGE